MEAEDTVMSQKEIDIIDARGVIGGDIVPYLNRQAEISFKAGVEEGKRQLLESMSDAWTICPTKGGKLQ